MSLDHHDALRTARLAAGWTHAEAARIVGCHYTHISELERGLKLPSRLMLAKLQGAYHPHLDGVDIPTRERGRPKKIDHEAA